jgi:hypothetical protein
MWLTAAQVDEEGSVEVLVIDQRGVNARTAAVDFLRLVLASIYGQILMVMVKLRP